RSRVAPGEKDRPLDGKYQHVVAGARRKVDAQRVPAEERRGEDDPKTRVGEAVAQVLGATVELLDLDGSDPGVDLAGESQRRDQGHEAKQPIESIGLKIVPELMKGNDAPLFKIGDSIPRNGTRLDYSGWVGSSLDHLPLLPR